MSRYTNEQLKEMALVFVEEHNRQIDLRWLQLVLTVGAITGLEPDQVIERIRDIARS